MNNHRPPMSPVLTFLAPLALALVALVLFLGLFNLARGGSGQRSQILMRWRVGLQFVAIVVVMATLYFGTR